jgi:hypothetical protein
VRFCSTTGTSKLTVRRSRASLQKPRLRRDLHIGPNAQTQPQVREANQKQRPSRRREVDRQNPCQGADQGHNHRRTPVPRHLREHQNDRPTPTNFFPRGECHHGCVIYQPLDSKIHTWLGIKLFRIQKLPCSIRSLEV